MPASEKLKVLLKVAEVAEADWVAKVKAREAAEEACIGARERWNQANLDLGKEIVACGLLAKSEGACVVRFNGELLLLSVSADGWVRRTKVMIQEC